MRVGHINTHCQAAMQWSEYEAPLQTSGPQSQTVAFGIGGRITPTTLPHITRRQFLAWLVFILDGREGAGHATIH